MFKVSRYVGLVQLILIFLQCVLHFHCEIYLYKYENITFLVHNLQG